MILRYIPTTSHYDRRIEQEQFKQLGGGLENAAHSLFLMRRVDRCGHNDYVVKTRDAPTKPTSAKSLILGGARKSRFLVLTP